MKKFSEFINEGASSEEVLNEGRNNAEKLISQSKFDKDTTDALIPLAKLIDAFYNKILYQDFSDKEFPTTYLTFKKLIQSMSTDFAEVNKSGHIY